MKLLLKRFEKTQKSTIGLLFVNGEFFSFTLEDIVRPDGAPKVYGKTAISAGTYPIDIRWSEHFKQNMPHVDNVPNFEGILIHWGNKDTDTDGCVLVGRSHTAGEDFVGSSRVTFTPLYAALRNAQAAGEKNTIQIVNEFSG